jgi:Short C-terminal domain
MRRRPGRGRSGPGLLGTVARTAVVAGTASAVVGRVSAGQEAAAQRERQAAADRQQLQEMQMQARVHAQVDEALGRQAAAPAPAPAGRSVDDLHAQLTKLGELRQAGLLTDDEFAAQKARLLA